MNEPNTSLFTCKYDKDGAQATYLRTRQILEKSDLLDKLPLERVWVISNKQPFLVEMQSTLNVAPGTGIIIGSTRLPTMYVYLSPKRRIGPAKKRRIGPKKKAT